MFPLNLYARVRFFRAILHTRPRVQRAPGIPCSLFFEGAHYEELGRIAPGYRANLVLMDHEFKVQKTWIEGRPGG